MNPSRGGNRRSRSSKSLPVKLEGTGSAPLTAPPCGFPYVNGQCQNPVPGPCRWKTCYRGYEPPNPPDPDQKDINWGMVLVAFLATFLVLGTLIGIGYWLSLEAY